MNFRMQTFILIMSLHVLYMYVAFFVEAHYLDARNIELQKRDGETSTAVERLCRMSSQQSAIINNTLYLMGGNVVYGSDSTWQDRSSQIAAPNTYLRAIDLAQDFSLSDGFLHTHRYDIPSDVPDIAEGHLWADEDRLVLVGGFTERVNKTFPNYTAPTASYEVWSYDLGSKDGRIWKTLPMGGGNKIMRAFNAAGTYVANLRKGFLLGGMVAYDSQSIVPLSMGGVEVGGLLIWDGAKESWENKSTPWKRRHSAGGFYLPYGEQGILAFFGGLTDEGNKLAYDNFTFPMNRIDIYDIAKDEWYYQNATGNVPSHRANFCGQVISAPDNSSHQIYIFGGAGANSLPSGDVYVLTIPTFRWQLAWDGNIDFYSVNRVPLPREYATCNLVSGGYAMMVFGGKISADIIPTSCDSGGIYLFNLNEWHWELQYSSNPQQYEVPLAIRSTFGSNGTDLEPEIGFEDAHVEALMRNVPMVDTEHYIDTDDLPRRNKTNTHTETPKASNTPHSSNHTNTSTSTAALAGAIIVGILATISLVGGFYWHFHRSPPSLPRKDDLAELDGSPIPETCSKFYYSQAVELPATRFSDSHQPYQLNLPEPVEMLAPSFQQHTITGPPPSHHCTHCPYKEHYVDIELDDVPPTPPPK